MHREELAAYEGNLAEQTADSHHQLQHVFSHLQVAAPEIFDCLNTLNCGFAPFFAELEHRTSFVAAESAGAALQPCRAR